jgi:hypothetical protein
MAILLLLVVAQAGAEPASLIKLRFELQLSSNAAEAEARIVVSQGKSNLRELQLSAESMHGKPVADGQLRRTGDRLIWNPPTNGGELRYQVRLTHRRTARDASSHDAWVGKTLALFRGEKAFPITAWRLAKYSSLQGVLAMSAPKGWSVITPYLPDAAGTMVIRNPGKRKARPLGWIIAGDIGTRRDVIAGSEITVSAPRGIRMERIAMLGLLRWTLPELVPALGKGPAYLSIVAAAEPMWLGALSAPNSIFVHANRPLISENGTSTIVHEMVHVLLADLKTPADQDWIDEGLAEFFALRALRDSGTISEARYVQTIASLREWGSTARSLRSTASSGPVTARSVAVFHDLDAELRRATDNRKNLANLVHGLLSDGEMAELGSLRQKARQLIGHPPNSLTPIAAPGFD